MGSAAAQDVRELGERATGGERPGRGEPGHGLLRRRQVGGVGGVAAVPEDRQGVHEA